MLFSKYLFIGVCTWAVTAWGAPAHHTTTSSTSSIKSTSSNSSIKTTSSTSSIKTTPAPTLTTSTTTSTSTTTTTTAPAEIDCVNTDITGATCGCTFQVRCQVSAILQQNNVYGVYQTTNWDGCLNQCDGITVCAAFSYEESTNQCALFLSGSSVTITNDPVGVYGQIVPGTCACSGKQ